MLIFALLFVLVGWGLAALLLIGAYKVKKGRLVLVWTMAGCFFSLGAIPLVAYLLDSAKLFAIGISLPLGVLLAFLSVHDLLRYTWCTVSVQACVRDVACVYSRHRTARYAPLFFYQYLGKSYEAQSFLHYSRRLSELLFKKGEQLEIFVDPRAPENCADKRKFPRCHFLLLLGALCFLALTIFLICTPSQAITMRI